MAVAVGAALAVLLAGTAPCFAGGTAGTRGGLRGADARTGSRTVRLVKSARLPFIEGLAEKEEPAWSKKRTVASPEATVSWVRGLMVAAEERRLALPEAFNLLVAVSPVMGVSGLAESAGLAGIADRLDLIDAQELIREGEARTAALLQSDGLIALQLALRNGSNRHIALFRHVTA